MEDLYYSVGWFILFVLMVIDLIYWRKKKIKVYGSFKLRSDDIITIGRTIAIAIVSIFGAIIFFLKYNN